MIVTIQKIEDIILSNFIYKSETMHNCASIVIDKETIGVYPRSGYKVTDYVDEKLLSIAREKGFEYNKNESDDYHLVFIKK